MDDALVRAEPSQLAVRLQFPVDPAEVSAQPVDVSAHQRHGALSGGSDAQVVAAADGEGEAVPGEIRVVRVQDDVRRRVVAILVHRVGSVAGQRGREADVDDLHRGDAWHGRPLTSNDRWDLSTTLVSFSMDQAVLGRYDP